MTALAADKGTIERAGEQFVFPVLANAKIYKGAIVVLDASGWLKPAVSGTGLIAVGIAQQTVDATGATSGQKTCQVRKGVFGAASNGDITKANIGDACYLVDDQTVSAGNTSQSVAGVIVDYDGTNVFVEFSADLSLATTGLLAANNLSDVGTAATAAHNLGLGTADSPTFSGLTLTGAEVGTTAAFTGNVTSLHPVATKTTTYAIATATDGDALLQSLTDGQTFTLPAAVAGNKGQKVTVQNIAANSGALITVNPTGTDAIQGAVMAIYSGGVSAKGWNNTKATAKKGDYSTFQSDGAGIWWLVGGMGVWASTP